MKRCAITVLNAKHNVALRCQVFENRWEPRHCVSYSVREQNRDDFWTLLAPLFSDLGNWRLDLDILSDALQVSKRSFGQYVLTELHEPCDGLFSIMCPLVIRAWCLIVSGGGIVNRHSICRGPFHGCHDASNFESSAARRLETVIEISGPKEEHQQHRYQHREVVIVVGDFFEKAEEEGQWIESEATQQGIQVDPSTPEVVVQEERGHWEQMKHYVHVPGCLGDDRIWISRGIEEHHAALEETRSQRYVLDEMRTAWLRAAIRHN